MFGFNKIKFNKINYIYKGFYVFFLLFILLIPKQSFSIIPPAGTMITDEVVVTYHNLVTNKDAVARANFITLEVSPIKKLYLDNSDLNIYYSDNGRFRRRIMVENMGNTDISDIFFFVQDSKVKLINFSEDAHFGISHDTTVAPGIHKIHLDTPLPSGDFIYFYMKGTVINPSENKDIPFPVEIGSYIDHSDNTADFLLIHSDLPPTNLDLSLTANQSTANVNDNVQYHASETAQNNLAVDHIEVDGVTEQLVVFEIPVPLGVDLYSIDTPSSFATGNTGNGSTLGSSLKYALYHIRGEDSNSYHTVAPVDLTKVDSIAFAYDNVNANDIKQQNFTFHINKSAGDVVIDSVYYEYWDDGVIDRKSSSAFILKINHNLKDNYFKYIDSNETVETKTLLYHKFRVLTRYFDCEGSFSPSQITIDLISQDTNDTAQIQAYETVIGSGIFVSDPVIAVHGKNDDNSKKFIMSAAGDTINGKVTSCSVEGITKKIDNINLTDSANPPDPLLSGNIGINAGGIVFSSTNKNNMSNNIQIHVLKKAGAGYNLVATYTTDANGVFSSAALGAGTYKVNVDNLPVGYVFPSNMNPTKGGSYHLSDGSFGLDFTLNAGDDFNFDIPVDNSTVSNIANVSITKQADLSNVVIGDILTYSIKFTNNSGITYQNGVLKDFLPEGVKFKGNIYLDGNKLGENSYDVTNGIISIHAGSIPDLAPGDTHEIKYLARIMYSNENILTNRAKLIFGNKETLLASASVNVSKGVFTENAYIVGNVYVDKNNNAKYDSEDLPISGIKVTLSNGKTVTTDNYGRYHFANLKPYVYALRLDMLGLPKGTKLLNPQDDFFKLNSYAIKRVDFRIKSTNEVDTIVQKKKLNIIQSELTPIINSFSNTSVSEYKVTAKKTDKKIKNSDVKEQKFDFNMKKMSREKKSKLSKTIKNYYKFKAFEVNVSSDILNLYSYNIGSNALEFLNIKDKQVIHTNLHSIKIKASLSSKPPIISINGKILDNSHSGLKYKSQKKNLLIVDYLGINLKKGENIITIKQANRTSKIKVYYRPIAFKGFEIKPDQGSKFYANGSFYKVKILAIGENGKKYLQKSGQAQIKILDGDASFANTKDSKNIKILFINGEANLYLLSPNKPENVNFDITFEQKDYKNTLYFAPFVRPLFINGVASVGVGHLNNKDNDIEDVLNSTQYRRNDNNFVNFDGSVYAIGNIGNNYLLDLKYDGAKEFNAETAEFNNFPKNGYSLLGDNSLNKEEDLSNSKLYVRLDKNKSYAQYGNYNVNELINLNDLDIDSNSDNNKNKDFFTGFDYIKDNLSNIESNNFLGAFSSETLGISGNYNFKSNNNLFYFASKADYTTKYIEFRSRGVSGPYNIGSTQDILPDSISVQVIVRSAVNPAIIVSTTDISSSEFNADYLLKTIYFNKVIPAFEGANPVYIKVTYNIKSTISNTLWNYGLGYRGEINTTKVMTYYLKSSQEKFNITDVLIADNISDNLNYLVEIVGTNSQEHGSNGLGSRVLLNYQLDNLKIKDLFIYTDDDFYNPSNSVSSTKLNSLTVSNELIEGKELSSNLLYSENTQDRLKSITESYDLYKIKNLTLKIGARFTQNLHKTDLKTYSDPSILLQVKTNPVKNITLGFQMEQSIKKFNAKKIGVLANYNITKSLSLKFIDQYIRNPVGEFDGIYALMSSSDLRQQISLGLTYNPDPSMEAFSNYETNSDGSPSWDNGIEYTLFKTSKLNVKTGLEYQQFFKEEDHNKNGVAFNIYTSYRASKKLLYTFGFEQSRISGSTKLFKTAVFYKRNQGSIWFLTNLYSYSTGQVNRWFRVGNVYRPLLSRYTFLQEFNFYSTKQGSADKRNKYIYSLLTNYYVNNAYQLSFHYAFKYEKDYLLGQKDSFAANLGAFSISRNFTKHWGIAVNTSLYKASSNGTSKHTIGSEVFYNINSSVKFYIGYNYVGYDNSISSNMSNHSTAKGLYMGFLIQFAKQVENKF